MREYFQVRKSFRLGSPIKPRQYVLSEFEVVSPGYAIGNFFGNFSDYDYHTLSAYNADYFSSTSFAGAFYSSSSSSSSMPKHDTRY